MRSRRASAALSGLLTVGALAVPLAAPAQQLTVDNLLEVQLGNTPFVPPENRTDTYDQLNATLAYPKVRIGARFEANLNSEDSFTYDEFTQRWFEVADDRLALRVGNFYTILGRGLLHRSFELPGVVLDQPGLRSRWGFSRDVDGVLVDAALGPLELRGLSGKPNGGEYSPSIAEFYGIERHQGELIGGQGALRAWRGSMVGAAYSRYSGDGTVQHEYASGFTELDPLRMLGVDGVALPVYFEYAREGARLDNWFEFGGEDDSVPSALYAGGNLLWGPFGLSAEWKDYTRFRFGTNDPPSLVREHTYPLLNRSTHVVNLEDEAGYQFEATCRLADWGELTGNLSRGDGRVSPVLPPRRFAERYLELRATPARWPGAEFSLFYDAGEDEFVGVPYREVFGGTAAADLPWELEATLDVEHLQAERTPDRYEDDYLSFALQHARLGSAALVWQRTTDPAEESPDDALTPGVQPRHYLAGVLSAEITERHTAALFVGQRREGLACTAGTCYKVEAFEGVEVRLVSRF